MAVLKVRQRGQLTLPKEMRSLLSIQENGNLLASVQGNSIILTPLPETSDDIENLVGLLPPNTGVNLQEARKAAQQDRAEKRSMPLQENAARSRIAIAGDEAEI